MVESAGPCKGVLLDGSECAAFHDLSLGKMKLESTEANWFWLLCVCLDMASWRNVKRKSLATAIDIITTEGAAVFA